jgi:REP element-mobilizing transposase RayT
MRMVFFHNRRHRKPNRLHGYNYSSPGHYFVTICTRKKAPYFGEVKNEVMVLNEAGMATKKCWRDLPNHYWNCVLDEFVIMPNHLHGIVVIDNNHHNNAGNCFVGNGHGLVGNGLKPFPTMPITMIKKYTLSEIVRGFKTFSSKKINKIQTDRFQWQKSFYDHIIRDKTALQKIREYIRMNPMKWDSDRNNPKNCLHG